MIASCKLCSELITPAASLHGVTPRQFAAMPQVQRDVLGLTAAVTQHLQTRHAEYYGVITQLVSQCAGVLGLHTVDISGLSGPEVADMLECDRALLIAYLQHTPSAPPPEVLAPLQARMLAVTARLNALAESGTIVKSTG